MLKGAKWWVAIALIALVAAACGGDSGDDATPGSTATTANQPGDNGDADADGSQATTTSQPEDQPPGGDLSLVPEGETDILGNPAGQGFVEIGGTRYDFILNAACQKLFGAVQASGPAADGSDVRVDAIIPPVDWETDTDAGWDPPFVQIDIDDFTWRAETGMTQFVDGENVELPPEQSSVGTFTNDGSLTAGEAVFFKLFHPNEVDTMTGSFEFYCP